MDESIVISDCSLLSNDFKEELINLFLKIDKDATGKTYNNSTVEMSKKQFDLCNETTKKDALEKYINEFGEIVVFAVDKNSDTLIGFTLLKPYDELFSKYLPNYKPLISITYSGVHPNYQRQGV